MDNNLTIPVPRIPQLPPPIDKLLVLLTESDTLDRINIGNPLSNDDIPDSEEAHNALYGLNRLRETLTAPFSSPETKWTREQWLRLVLELIATVHEGLINAQLFTHSNLVPHDAFGGLYLAETGLISRL